MESGTYKAEWFTAEDCSRDHGCNGFHSRRVRGEVEVVKCAVPWHQYADHCVMIGSTCYPGGSAGITILEPAESLDFRCRECGEMFESVGEMVCSPCTDELARLNRERWFQEYAAQS